MNPRLKLWQAMVLPAVAGGMGWGIRGQYGHETGAMIDGILVGLTLILLFVPKAPALWAARAAALFTIGISYGGCETYGQTVGLTHDPKLVGNVDALRWGLVGLFLKGGLWIGLAGALLGIGLSGVRYRLREVAWIGLGLIALMVVGIALFNRPFDPAHRQLPPVYFSSTWELHPGADVKPRDEKWGGLLLALVGLALYTGWRRTDALTPRLAAVGFLAGGVGFSLGQCVQAYHAWHVDWFRTGWMAPLEPHMNWWNMMEISFGAIAGAGLGLGLWLLRAHIAPPPGDPPPPALPLWGEGLLAFAHLAILTGWCFAEVPPTLETVGDLAFTMGLLPLIGVVGGRVWPYLLLFPITAVPIAGKTLNELCYEHPEIAPALGWPLAVVLPLGLLTFAALRFARPSSQGAPAESFARPGLALATCTYFLLNFGFFRFPWVWAPWTGRTPSGIIFTLCTAVLLVFALRRK